MKTQLSKLLMNQNAGRLLAWIPLKGSLEPLGGSAGPVSLARTPSGAYLVAELREGSGSVIALKHLAGVHYQARPLGDRLEVSGAVFSIPPGKGAQALSLLGLSRLERAPLVPPPSRFVEAWSPVVGAWLRRCLAEDELLLAWLETGDRRRVASTLLSAEVSIHFLVTDRRAALVAINGVGDGWSRALPVVPMQGTRQGRGGGVAGLQGTASLGRGVAGAVPWRTTLGNDKVYRVLESVTGLAPHARCLEMARLHLRWAGADQVARDWARSLLVGVASAGDPLGRLSLALLDHDGPSGEVAWPAEALLEAARGDPDALAGWWADWGHPSALGRRMLAQLEEAGEGAAALPLHRRLHAVETAAASGPLEAARLDICLGEHLLALGQHAEAQRLLEARLQALPELALLDLVPPADPGGSDLTEAPHRVRVRLLEALARARGRGEGSDGAEDPATLVTLAQLHPLEAERMAAVVARGPRSVRPRAAVVQAALQVGGLVRPAEGPLERPQQGLDAALLETMLRHPAGREGGVLGRLQGYLADVQGPDRGVLKGWCERLEARSPTARRALTDAALVFGLPVLEAFVSRGERDVGVRAYEGTPPFVVIGGRHLESGELELTEGPLRFALGAEVAHVRFQHTRATSSEVWEGLWQKGWQGLDVVLSVLPAVTAFKATRRLVPQRLLTLAAKVPSSLVPPAKAVGSALQSTLTALGVGQTSGASDTLSAADFELVVAHRVMQLTADRAGLLLCGDLVAGLRAMYLLHPAYSVELAVAERLGLAASIGRRDGAGDLLYPELAVRAASLIAFYLSDDFQRLREALEVSSE